MAENNNNGGKNTNIITKINDTISKVLGDFPPVDNRKNRCLRWAHPAYCQSHRLYFPGYCERSFQPLGQNRWLLHSGSLSLRLLVRGKTANDSR